MGKLRALMTAAMMAVALTMVGSAGTVLATDATANLLVNGSAQAGHLAPWYFDSVRCVGATTTFSIRMYTDSDVPADGQTFGPTLFSGSDSAGDTSPKCIAQLIDLRPYKTQITTGHVDWKLSAWLGVGNDPDTDQLRSSACFEDVNQNLVGHCKTGPQVVGPSSDRLTRRVETGDVPTSARFVLVVFAAIDNGGDPPHPDLRNRACFDQAQFRLILP